MRAVEVVRALAPFVPARGAAAQPAEMSPNSPDPHFLPLPFAYNDEGSPLGGMRLEQ
jgi:hypothetical protein